MVDSSDDDTEFRDISKLSYTKISSGLTKLGYAEGITAGRESVFQDGFDVGYIDGLRIGFDIAKFNTLANVLAPNTTSHQLNAELKLLKSNNLLDIKSPVHFQMNNLTEKSLTRVSEAQKKYTDDFIQAFRNKYSAIDDLLV